MINRLFGTPRLVVRTSVAMFAVVTIVLASILLLIAIQGSHYARETVTDKLTAGQRMLSALEQRQSRELQTQVAILAESPTLKAAIDTYQSELAISNASTRAELILTIERELGKLAERIQPDVLAVSDPEGHVVAVAGRYRSDWPRLMTPPTAKDRESMVPLPSGLFRRVSAPLALGDAGHSERVAAISVAIGREMQVPPEQLDVLRLGALLHDIGKIGISDNVLRKPTGLTPEEFELIKQHPALGARILRTVPFLTEHLPIVELHHERPDGRGYPYGLTSSETPLLARIVHVADAFDAMTSARAYRPALDSSDAMRELWSCAGTQFDAAVVQSLVSALAMAGPGTLPALPALDQVTFTAPRRLALAASRG